MPTNRGSDLPASTAQAQFPLTTEQTRAKSTAIRLATEAQVALDRGDIQGAKNLADQAEAIQVPDSAFGEGDLRPWEVGLRIQSAINRRTDVQPAANFEPVNAAVAENNPGSRYPVAQGVYNPSDDKSRNVLVQNQVPTPAADLPEQRLAFDRAAFARDPRIATLNWERERG